MYKTKPIENDGKAAWKIWDENLGEEAFSLIAETQSLAVSRYNQTIAGGICTTDSMAYFEAWKQLYGHYISPI